MRKRKVRTNKQLPASGAHDRLLEFRTATLGLDVYAAECCDRKKLKKIVRRCRKCGARKTCAADLKRDPFDPVWRTYCRNSEALMQLAMAWWPRAYPGSWGGITRSTEHELD
jgi:hypothetical protein